MTWARFSATSGRTIIIPLNPHNNPDSSLLSIIPILQIKKLSLIHYVTCPKPTAIHTEWNTVVGHTPDTRVSLKHKDLDGGGERSATKEEAPGTGQA